MQLPQITEVRGIRVLTTKQIAKEYGVEEKHIKQNYANNRERFIEGKHYISLQNQELREFKCKVENFDLVGKTAKILYLWTEKGALLHAKSLNTDKAWEVYDYLVDFYFRAKEEKQDTEKSTEVVPVKTTVEPAHEKNEIPKMNNPIGIFRILLKVAEENDIEIRNFQFVAHDSVLKSKMIGIRNNLLLEKVVFELAYELSHLFIHYDQGNMIKSQLEKDYNDQAERAAKMVIQMLDRKVVSE